MKGYTGKTMRVNLSKGSITFEATNVEEAIKFLGGRGYGTKMLMDEIDPKIDALSEENKLIVATGPLTGTPTPTGGRYMIVTKSPLTDTVASSNSGGFWGAELKSAGYDYIIIEGRSDRPVYLNIEDEKVEIKDAGHLWGKLVSETTDILNEELGKKTKVMTIGPAGEKLSRMAAIMNEKDRAAGRSGVGAVMGSKNLKAIAVKGTGKVEVADPEALKAVFKESLMKIKENGVTGSGLPTYGTAVLVNIINENGVFPVNNFQSSQFDRAEELSGETLTEKYLVRNEGCYACPIKCGRRTKVDDIESGGPEYETIWAYGGNCGVSNMGEVIKANYWCNELGLDTISAGTTIAAAMELFQKGYLKDEDMAGVPLEFGNEEAAVEWTKRMGMREGFGDIMADGSYRLTARYGMEELSMSVKKQELPAYDPRGIQGQGLQYATSNRGGCHVRGYLISPEILALPEALDRFELDGKPFWTKIFQDLTASIDSLGLCLFTSFALGADDYAKLTNAVVGTEFTADDILVAGDRIWNIEKLFNLESGVDPSQDTLPKRLLEEPIPEGPSKGWVTELGKLLPKYYELRGWSFDGMPTEEKLKSLGIDQG
jgi:aldehyde:ferredoxin oxidoreductase